MSFKKIVSTFLIVVSISFNTLSQSQNQLEKTILKGLEHSYHFKWDKAEEVFKDLVEKYPERPEGYHFLSSISAWYYLSSKNKIDYDSFVSYSDIALEKGEDELEKNPEDDKLLFIMGSNYSYRAIVFAAAENYLDAVWAGKKSDSYLSDALEINPQRYDSYLGLGLFKFAAGQTPAAFRWALKLAGISGDIDTGLDNIKLAAEKGKITKVEAQYYYSQIASEYEIASGYLSSL
ncbi:MAG TPA: hypothetical protein VLN45_03820, partial [Ignavibacteriaceae bacterium]|nr:hypothetical protein [Ignavibacteriaceae bacterium]